MTTIPITLLTDGKGYIDRECPNEDCGYTYKVLLKDWEDKSQDGYYHCPLCGCRDIADNWWTQDQIDQIKSIAISWAINDIQKKLERSTKNNKFVKFKPNKKITFLNNPIGQSDDWETEIRCNRCGTHYSVIGSAYFCPCCGFNSAVNSFNDSLDSIEKMLESLCDMKAMLIDKYNVDSAETMCRSMLENSIGDLVSTFQKFASCKYDELSGETSRVNDFQIVDKGSRLFEAETGKRYSDWLSTGELAFMELMFQRRHLLEHNNGIVDQQYLNKTSDTSYSLGQRIIVKEADAHSLLDILRKLGSSIETLQIGGDSDGN